MSNHRPRRLNLGPLEREIMEILWDLGTGTTRDIHQRLLADPDRELAYTSVSNILRRLVEKGWLTYADLGRIHHWSPCLHKSEAEALLAQDQLEKFLALTDSTVVAAFAEQLAPSSLERLKALVDHIEEVRKPSSDS